MPFFGLFKNWFQADKTKEGQAAMAASNLYSSHDVQMCVQYAWTKTYVYYSTRISIAISAIYIESTIFVPPGFSTHGGGRKTDTHIDLCHLSAYTVLNLGFFYLDFENIQSSTHLRQ